MDSNEFILQKKTGQNKIMHFFVHKKHKFLKSPDFDRHAKHALKD